MTYILKIILTIFTLVLTLLKVSAFEISGNKWPKGEVNFYVDMNGAAASGISWNTAFIAAMNDWSKETSFNFVLIEKNRDPCANDGLSSVDFAEEFCGSEFGENTLAVTVRRSTSSILGPPALSEANIIINDNEQFNVYDGNLIQFGIQGLDFRRVALHELGHAIGLDHETSNSAIMAPNIGNLDRLQEDDIAGAEALYDGSINCAINDLVYGTTKNALDANDCTVSKLLPGSDDSSPIDLYGFALTSPATIDVSMNSTSLDSVLLIADEKLQIVGFDNKSNNECNSSLTQFLLPGNYFLLANTFTTQVNVECEITGDYQINASLSSTGLNPLGSSASLTGAPVNATFSGGISSNNGGSFRNQFVPNASLDISARIDIDPQHVGQAGFVVIAAMVGQQILFLNELGQFVDAAANPGVITRAANKALSGIEELSVVENLVPASLGITEIQVGFYFGYGLSSNPAELYYHQAPLNLLVAPLD
jgi:Matrixin